jgi:hypothetical protein
MYSATIRLPNGKSFKLDNIVGDGFVATNSNMIPVRFFHLKSGERVEVSVHGAIIRFDPAREKNIAERNIAEGRAQPETPS